MGFGLSRSGSYFGQSMPSKNLMPISSEDFCCPAILKPVQSRSCFTSWLKIWNLKGNGYFIVKIVLPSRQNSCMVNRPKKTMSDFIPTKRPPKENETFLEKRKRDGEGVLLGLLGYQGFLVFQQPFGRSKVKHSFFGRTALSFGIGAERSFYYKIDAPI